MTVTRPTTTAAADFDLEKPQRFYDVPGWFFITDLVLFDWFLARQNRQEGPGDLLEMGAYMGKSAIFMGRHLRPGERFTVCDLFDSEAPDSSNEAEVRGSYSTLTRRAFESNYLTFHQELPHVIQAPTSVVPARVEAGSCRFVHVDASHLYEHVRPDIAAARDALRKGGVVSLDDFRSEHTPGVACASWQAMLEDGLRPICISPTKFYGTWGDPEPLQQELEASLRERGDCWLNTQEVAGHRLLIVGGRKAKPPQLPVPLTPRPAQPVAEPASRPETRREAGPDARSEPQAARRPKSGPAPARRPRSRLRRLAVDLTPPILTRAIVRARRARRGMT